MRLNVILRRARRLGPFCILTSIHQQFQRTSAPTKHIKIDDEESLSHIHPSSRLLHMLETLSLILLALLILIITLAYTIYKPPNALITFLQWKYPDVLFHVDLPPSQRVVALTLDDAPSSSTAAILDLLQTHGAKATFFVIGSQISAHPELVQRIHDEGHDIGNHAWADEVSLRLPLSELERQVKEVQALIPANSDGVKYFRPGSGFFNAELVGRVRGLGYRVVLGSIYPHDPQIHSPRMNARHVLSMVRPGGIIIMHDRRSYSAVQLELVLKGLKEGGWKVESLSGMLRIANEGMGNVRKG